MALQERSPIQVNWTFPYQSYFDSTLQKLALNQQGQTDQIVAGQNSDTPGFGVALDPNSETPVAVEFKRSSHTQAGAAPLILRPGQTVFPFGRGSEDYFDGFRWGLPAGWLGGGRAMLTVLGTPRAEVKWNVRSEFIFHRQRMQVLPDNTDLAALATAASIRPNWPLQFPSRGSQRLSSTGGAVKQAGEPQLTVIPIRTIIRLVADAVLTRASTVRFIFYGTQQFDTGAAMALVAGSSFFDVTWPIWGLAGIAGPMQCPFQVFGLDNPLTHMGVDFAPEAGAVGVVPIDLGDGDDLSRSYVDVLRVGRF